MKNLDKLHALRTTIKNLTKDIKNLVSLKYMCEYENTIKETYNELFDIEILVKTEIVKYYIDNFYVNSSSYNLELEFRNRCRNFIKIYEPSI